MGLKKIARLPNTSRVSLFLHFKFNVYVFVLVNFVRFMCIDIRKIVMKIRTISVQIKRIRILLATVQDEQDKEYLRGMLKRYIKAREEAEIAEAIKNL